MTWTFQQRPSKDTGIEVRIEVFTTFHRRACVGTPTVQYRKQTIKQRKSH